MKNKNGLSPPHKTVAVKVNAIVDKRIAPLVLALNQLPIWTLDSCEGKDGNLAYVFFRYLGTKNKEPDFISNLAEAMIIECEGEDLFAISLEWRGGNEPLGRIVCAPEDICRVSDIVHSTASSDRMIEFLGDTEYRALRS